MAVAVCVAVQVHVLELLGSLQNRRDFHCSGLHALTRCYTSGPCRLTGSVVVETGMAGWARAPTAVLEGGAVCDQLRAVCVVGLMAECGIRVAA